MDKSSTRSLILIISLLTMLALPWPAQAQTPTPHEALVQAIQDRAQRDVASGRPQATISDLNVLFGEQAVAVGLPMSDVLNIYEGAYIAVTPAKPWWGPLRPLITWAGIAALVLLVFQNFFKEYLTRFVKWAGSLAYNQLAGYKPFWWIALRRYRRALVKKYQELSLIFS